MVIVTCVSYMNILMLLWLYFVLSLDLIIVSLLLLKVISVYYHWVSSFVSLSSLHYLLYCRSCCCLLVISYLVLVSIISFVPFGIIFVLFVVFVWDFVCSFLIVCIWLFSSCYIILFSSFASCS